jgi:hypothetical protein
MEMPHDEGIVLHRRSASRGRSRQGAHQHLGEAYWDWRSVTKGRDGNWDSEFGILDGQYLFKRRGNRLVASYL